MQNSNTFSSSDVVVLGTARSAKMHLGSVKKAFPIYKKQYWIARELSGVLEFYKNDQDPQAKGTIRAAQIKGVSFSGDKQNKFFDLSVLLRGGVERRIRLNSREERNRWYRVLSTMATRHSTQSQWNSVMSAIQRRLASASSHAPYRFVVDLEGISGAPAEMLQYCVEAVDRGIEFAHSIAKTLAGTSALKESAAAVPVVNTNDVVAGEATPIVSMTTLAPTDSTPPSSHLEVSAGAPTPAGLAMFTPSSSSAGLVIPFVSVQLVITRLHAADDGRSSPSLFASLTGPPSAVGGDGTSDVAGGTAVSLPSEADLQRAANAATRYDPQSKELILAILLSFDATSGDAIFKHMPLHKVVSMLQSNVWRNPVIEGWLSQDPDTQAHLDFLNTLIDGKRRNAHEGPRSSSDNTEDEAEDSNNEDGAEEGVRPRTSNKAKQNTAPKGPLFSVTMQWGHDMDAIHESRLEAYLREHVSYLLLEDVTAAVEQLIAEFPEQQPRSGASDTRHCDPSQTPDQSIERCLPSAQQCLRKYVVGVAICLDRTLLEDNASPPLELLHRMWGDRDLNTGAIVMAKLHRRGGLDDVVSSPHHHAPHPPHRREETLVYHSVAEQLRELVLTVRLSHAFRLVDQHLSSVYGVRDGCRVDWESFVGAARSANVEVIAEDLPVVALSFAQHYLTRPELLVRSLRATRVNCAGGVAGSASTPQSFLEATFLPCVSTVSVEFISREAQLLNLTAPPSIRSGIFSDVVVLWNASTLQSGSGGLGAAGPLSLDSAMDVSDGCAPVRIHPHCPLMFTYNISMLSPWVKGYFSNPGNLILAPDRHASPDMDDDDSSSSSSEEFVPDFGDAVASERKEETQVLNLQQVVNLIYDAQHGIPVALKIGSGAVREAIDSLQRCFREGPISKHILVQIYTTNLQRLRELFIRVSREEQFSRRNDSASSQGRATLLLYGPISRAGARRLLQDYCEYSTTEAKIDTALDTAEVLQRTFSRSALSEAIGRAASPSGNILPPTSSMAAGQSSLRLNPSDPVGTLEEAEWQAHSPTYAQHSARELSAGGRGAASAVNRFDFEAVAAIALCALLPFEAEMAISCRRDILWMGLEDTGKTLLINSIRGIAHATHPTIGLTESVIAFKEWVFGCKELGGRADFRRNWKQYMDRVDALHAVVFVVDAGKPASFAEAAQYLHGVSESSRFSHLPFLIIFNNYRAGDRKAPAPQALYDALKLHRVRSKHELQYVTCDVTVVHSKLKVLSSDVRAGLNWLCQVFARSSATLPPEPKAQHHAKE